ncbi:BREX-2 system adenine-specific DNA-methyltransferase PglX [Frankia sp. Cas3]|uniref:BREX-2 system adenine-specific DNA-methyltransferase PglX n=1 Tax=Frankia sp. Cas3 TaxID=3073926 RepID=UPI002AD28713|nr:BREX-2 system adenine-specific DNA-methyltransferase PglX [Frankia sp. Cas3]
MSAAEDLIAGLAAQVTLLETDLRDRVESQPTVKEDWQREHAAAVRAERTAAGWIPWRDEQVTLVAVSWVLTTVFIRFCEDNDLLKPVWIAPRHRRQEAADAYAAFFRDPAHSLDTDREWLLEAINYLRGVRATAGLVDDHVPLWKVSPSADAATALLEFWRQRDDSGRLVHGTVDGGSEGGFHDETLSTRFLGDLYQDLSADARKRFALLQTPEFVEEFILDHTLTPALKDRPLEGFRLLDPTCGSGHFLLGAFPRLLRAWNERDENLEPRARVQKVLDSLFGVDLNPDAVAIARFRLTVLALWHSETRRLEEAPAFRFNLACGDSLRHGEDQRRLEFGGSMDEAEVAAGFAYSTEDLSVLRTILEPGSYDVVVGNPPYITVEDKAVNKAYRDRFTTLCKGTYALTVPFMAQFFWLARGGERAGWVGQITSNSFMKREFGAPLIERFLVNKDLRLVADTSGAFIPGHGTPTVIVVGRNQPKTSDRVRAVLGTRGEPRRPDDPANAPVWSSIREHVDEHLAEGESWENRWITVTDLDRSWLARHPWSLTGGGAIDLRQAIESDNPRRLSEHVTEIGFGAVTREDSAYMLGAGPLRRAGIDEKYQRHLVEGDAIRDWTISDPTTSLWPYNPATLQAEQTNASQHLLWPNRRILSERVAYGHTQLQRGLTWFEYSMFFTKRYARPLSISFAFVATHNNFVLDRGGIVFKQSAPVIKLPEGASEDDHLKLVGVLNSSAGCFWLKQVSHDKGNRGEGGGITATAWERFFEFTGTTLQDFPLPETLPLARGRLLDSLARELAEHTPGAVCTEGVPTRARLDAARTEWERIRARMIAVQEELDWEVYRLYGIIDEDLTYSPEALPPLALGERAFEIELARQREAGEEETVWFERHRSTPITEIPERLPASYRELVQHRLDLMAEHRFIQLLEKPEYKRRWLVDPWEKRESAALRDWLLDRLEDRRFWFDAQGRPAPTSVAQLADEVARDPDLVSVLELWQGQRDVSVVTALTALLADEAVPFLAGYRYKPSGLRKRRAWEETWTKQREEDAAAAAGLSANAVRAKVGKVPVPPKYVKADFVKASYWRHRDKLDVPMERFISYLHAGRDNDPTPLLGWAGWDHAQQALALSVIIGAREADGWDDERLVPLVAGLAELQPWVDQWHTDTDPRYGVSLAEFCREQLTARAAQARMTRAELFTWIPKPVRKPAKKKPATSTSKKAGAGAGAATTAEPTSP